MELIIDIQPCFDKNHHFYPKEVGVLSLEEEGYAHWMVKQPHEFSQLDEQLQNTNNTLTKFVHNVEWFEGEVSLKHVHENLRDFVKNASRVFVVGNTKTEYMTNLLGRKVINLEKYYSPSFLTLDSMYKETVLTCCIYHKSKALTRCNCALHRAALIKHWIALLKKEFKNSTSSSSQKKKIVTNIVDRDEAEDETLAALNIYAIEFKKNSSVLPGFYSDTDDTESFMSTEYTHISSSTQKEPIERDIEKNKSEKEEENKENIEPMKEEEEKEAEEEEEEETQESVKDSKDEHMSNTPIDPDVTGSYRRSIPSGSNTEGVDETDSPSH